MPHRFKLLLLEMALRMMALFIARVPGHSRGGQMGRGGRLGLRPLVCAFLQRVLSSKSQAGAAEANAYLFISKHIVPLISTHRLPGELLFVRREPLSRKLFDF